MISITVDFTKNPQYWVPNDMNSCWLSLDPSFYGMGQTFNLNNLLNSYWFCSNTTTTKNFDNGTFYGTNSDFPTWMWSNDAYASNIGNKYQAGTNYSEFAQTSLQPQKFDNGTSNFDVRSCANSKSKSRTNNGTSSESKFKRDMVNYDVLRGHEYEIIDNPDKDQCVNKRLYICKYDDCNRIFTKTWNLVSHFRIHTNDKPYKWNECDKLFTQRSNLTRHVAIHWQKASKKVKMHRCTECSRKF